MAKMERVLQGNFDDILDRIESGVMRGSLSASLEDSSDFSDGSTRGTVLLCFFLTPIFVLCLYSIPLIC